MKAPLILNVRRQHVQWSLQWGQTAIAAKLPSDKKTEWVLRLVINLVWRLPRNLKGPEPGF